MAKKAPVKKALKFTVVKYGRRFNMGNYEAEDLSAEIAVEEGEDATEALGVLKEWVENNRTRVDAAETDEEAEETDEEEDVPPAKKKKASKKTKVVEEDEDGEDEELEDMEDDEEAEEDEEDEDEESDEEEESDEDEAEEPKSKKKAPAKKTFKKKGTVYDREDQLHKKLFVEACTAATGVKDWVKKNASKAKTVSVKLNGTDFLDADGDVVDTFKAAIKKLTK
jgi:hypothetical protein